MNIYLFSSVAYRHPVQAKYIQVPTKLLKRLDRDNPEEYSPIIIKKLAGNVPYFMWYIASVNWVKLPKNHGQIKSGRLLVANRSNFR